MTEDRAGGLPVRVYLLGGFTVTVGGDALPAPPLRVQALVGALLLVPRPWHRLRLVSLLFPDMPESRARQRLSHTLWQARRWLPELPLETTSEMVHLPSETLWLDLVAFREAAKGGAPGDWRHALALYRGELLEGLYEDWLLEEREATYLQYVSLLHRTCDALWQQREMESLVPVAERLAHAEPYDERALRTLMRAYQALGRRGAALAAYERCVSRLLDDVGAQPEPATCALAQAIQVAPAALSTLLAGNLAAAPATGHTGGSGPPVAGLLAEAHAALVRGEIDTVRKLATALRRHPACDVDALRLLEIDIALFAEEFALAARLLEGRDGPAATAAERLRAAQVALGRHDPARAQELAAEALVAVHRAGRRGPDLLEVESSALLALARAQLQLGQRGGAARSIERALVTARESGLHHLAAQALVLQGQARLREGRYDGAGACFREARAMALEHGLRRELAAALAGLRMVFGHTNALTKALAIGSEELSLWRDIGLVRREAAALEGLATIQNDLGRSAESLRTLAQAQALSDRLGDPVRTATHRYHLVCALLYHDDGLAREGVGVAEEALKIFRAHNETGWEAAALEIIGYALWVDGQYAAALAALREAEVLTRRLGELAFVPELLAYQGLAHVGLGLVVEALALTRQAVTLLAQGGVSDEAAPEILYAHAVTLAANDRQLEARGYLSQAYERMLDSAAAFEDGAARQAFFQRNPTLRRLMRELQARGIAPHPDAGTHMLKLPAARGGDPVRVVWTVDAGPPDAALKCAEGAIALRRVRLARLLAEAQAQGATATVADLALALDVSPRTIQRDLAALRR
jgi:DNA-binding SARP family transcriptional activator